MLTGELPGKPIEPPSHTVQMDVRLDEVVLRALEKEPERRYQQVSQMKSAVETISMDIGQSEVESQKSGVATCATRQLNSEHIAEKRWHGNFRRVITCWILAVVCAVAGIWCGATSGLPWVLPV